MFRRQAVFVAIVAGLAPLVLGSCGSSDALVLSLKSTQELSGANQSSPRLGAEVADSKLAFGYDLSYKVTKDLPNLGKSPQKHGLLVQEKKPRRHCETLPKVLDLLAML